MAEIRQRRGEPTEETQEKKFEGARKLQDEIKAAKEAGKPTEALEEAHKQQLIEEIARALSAGKPGKVKGLSNTAKQYKDQLQQDPFNMELIFNLGVAYADDSQWDKCCNVMLRGWKRVQEFEDPVTRYSFLTTLAEASIKTKKFRQALAVIQDAEEPEETDAKTHYELMRCQIYCENGDMQKGLKALNKAIEGLQFDQAAAVWANCLGSLKRVGAYEVSKSTLMAMAPSEDAKTKLEAMEKLAILKEEFYGTEDAAPSKLKQTVLAVIFCAAFSVLIYCLYLFESMSLAKLKLKS